MMLRNIALLGLLAVGLLGCGESEDRRLVGDWRAVSVTDGADSVRLNPAEIAFSFRPDNRYTFSSTLRYREAGTWSYRDGFLIAHDTTNADSQQRVVAVDKLTSDSLVLRMKAESAERTVVLLKE